MEVSTFELLYKPITPPLGAGTEAIARRVLQGYFLTIANLEDVPFRFRIELNITLPSPDNPARRLDGNVLFITDVASPDNDFATSLTRSPAGGNRYLRSFNVPAKATALVVVLPNITTPNFFGTPSTANVEVRGHVGLFLPRIFTVSPRPPGPGTIGFVAQAGAPARVLLTAEHRSTYLPPGWPLSATGDLDFDQTGVALPLASGKALHEIPSDPSPFSSPTTSSAVAEGLSRQRDLLEELDPLTSVVGGLARLDRSPDNLKKIGRVLEELGIPLELGAAAPRKDAG